MDERKTPHVPPFIKRRKWGKSALNCPNTKSGEAQSKPNINTRGVFLRLRKDINQR
jgi:hypothetical protein